MGNMNLLADGESLWRVKSITTIIPITSPDYVPSSKEQHDEYFNNGKNILSILNTLKLPI